MCGGAQPRQVDRAGDVVFGEFARGTDIDDLIEGREFIYGGGQAGLDFRGKQGIRSGFRHCYTAALKNRVRQAWIILVQTTPVAILAMQGATNKDVMANG